VDKAITGNVVSRKPATFITFRFFLRKSCSCFGGLENVDLFVEKTNIKDTWIYPS